MPRDKSLTLRKCWALGVVTRAIRVGVARQVRGVERYNITGVSIYHEPANDATAVSQHLTALLLVCLFVYLFMALQNRIYALSLTHTHTYICPKKTAVS